MPEATPRGGAEGPGRVPMLEMLGVTKRFPGVVADDRVDFSVHRGEVHSLLGENGAGKTTLMKVLYGLYQPDEGEIRLEGRPVRITSPAVAIRHGIGMIHQHFMLVPTLTVAENVALGLPSSRGPLADLDRVAERIRELSRSYGLKVDPGARVWQLSVGERQRVEIVKALYRSAALLILDEPTSVLTPQEVEDLFATLRQMARDGRGLVFISHKIHEVLEISDRITVLRGGRVVGTVRPAEVSRRELATMMVGRQVSLVQDRRAGRAVAEPGAGPSAPAEPGPVGRGEVELRVTDLTVPGDRGNDAVRGLSLEVRAGEIVGIAGVSGNGQRELAEAIAGLRTPRAGSIRLGGRDVTGLSPREVRSAGLAYVPEERMRDGIVPDFSVAENLILVDHRRFARWGFLRTGSIRRHAAGLASRFAVKASSLDTLARTLSGGNIQKLILARELSGAPRVLLVSQPTRGVDVGAAEYIHDRLLEQRRGGAAILIISEDLDEVLALSDRVVVMYDGTIIGEVDPRTATKEEVGLLMAGLRAERAGEPTGPPEGPGGAGHAGAEEARAPDVAGQPAGEAR
jgi:ABC-type uncharacterized transport system ATPase subunit